MSVVTSNQETDNQHLKIEEEDESEKKCKICLFEEEDEDDEEAATKGPFVDVCPCKGSVKYVHHNCLVSWFQSSGERKCPTCETEVEYTEKLKPWRQWRWEPMNTADKWVLMQNPFLIAFCLLMIYVIVEYIHKTQALDSFEVTLWKLCILMFIIVFIVLCILTWWLWRKYMNIARRYFRRLLSVNQQIVLKPYDRKQSECKRS